MAYDDIEDSVDNGEPLFFYEFIYDVAPGAAYRYVADTQRRVMGGKVWQPFAIKHDEITVSGSLDKQTLTVTARNDIAITALYIAGSPSREVQVNIWRGHADTADIVMEWTGRLLNCMWKGPDIEMSCESLSTALTAIGLRRKYQRGCPHSLYGKACRASRLAHTESGTVTTVNNKLDVNVTLSGAETGFTASNLIGGVFRVRRQRHYRDPGYHRRHTDRRQAVASHTDVADPGNQNRARGLRVKGVSSHLRCVPGYFPERSELWRMC